MTNTTSSLTTCYAYIKASSSATAGLDILQICSNLVLQPGCLIIAEAPFVLAGRRALLNLGSDFQTASLRESRHEGHH